VETHDSGRKVCLLLAVGALVVTLVGVLAGMRDKYFAVPSDDRSLSLWMPPESRYNFPYDATLALSPDSELYLHLDLRRLARSGLQAVVRQEQVCSGMPGRVETQCRSYDRLLGVRGAEPMFWSITENRAEGNAPLTLQALAEMLETR
jgi:hypothetical protein